MLADAGLAVNSVEPNDEMRKYGKIRTEAYTNVEWFEGVGEATGQEDNTFKLVSFGSSFNVCDRLPTLVEVDRIALSKAWFSAMWNHRSLNDPIQQKIEDIIKGQVPAYGYGVRREDQTDIIYQSGLFDEVLKFSGDVVHTQTIPEVVEAWYSHATLARQAGDKFSKVVSDIEDYLNSLDLPSIDVPYTTNVWMAQLKN
jgi:ubiquinone/menaquinone biosynthesis C-methylase UbiE